MQVIREDRIKEALGLLSFLRSLENSQTNLRMPPLQLPDADFQRFSGLALRIQVWLEGMRLSVPIQGQGSHTPDCEVLKIEPADKDAGLKIEVPS